ncbi:uncharacterized protein PFL1_06014 [Pseudozyma flocculosa PF-1]|uniref:ubiquitinyl hydrolase 1 n=1 Tax=Pseudozyma flocculosa PF-1 TaxID=1277687 RepID=A0A061H6Z7_9BASI|nr:uncharacterized protein PFL1_06014 [Pseudozyma flocculosa PF-1]EPQ26366.1 hypothetical protein PFL1_06014 [Pseudozyma flocculosa PF-1]
MPRSHQPVPDITTKPNTATTTISNDSANDHGHHNPASEPIQIQAHSPLAPPHSPRQGSRRPPPSPANSPGNIPSSTLNSLSVHHPPTAYKRARTVSPIIDDYSSDVDHDHRSPYSQPNSDNDSDPAHQQQQQLGTTHHLPLATSLHPTPLRSSHSILPSTTPPSSAAAAMSEPGANSASDMTIEGLMTEKSLRLDDPAAKLQHDAASAPSQPADDLPTYSAALADDSQPVLDIAATSRPSGAEQLKVIRPMKTQPMVVGEKWYLIDRSWYKLWSTAAAQEASAADGDDGDDAPLVVGPIDNRSLLEEGSSESDPYLRTQISEGLDFEMLPEEGWRLLASWYGVDGPVFSRQVVPGINPGQESIEFYPPRIRLLRMTDEMAETADRGAPIVAISVSQPLSDLKAQAKQLLALGDDVGDSSIRFWHVPEPEVSELQRGTVATSRIRDEGVELVDNNEDNALLHRPGTSLKELGLDETELTLAVETKAGGRWASDPAPAAAAASSKASLFAQTNGDFFANLQQGQQKSAAPAQLSTASSSIAPAEGRCLSNTYELQQYFVSGVYREELNTDNPLGMGGAIAEAFGNLIKQLWDGQGGSFWPREFKHALARFAPQFSGYAQHDSQELLAFLLDGLHEDLNRIIKKPYIEAPDWAGGGEKEMVAFAKKQWDIYKARNDSVIVDLFQGQYRSTLVCPDCEKVSIKFDPFMYLTLPIPNKKKWRCSVFFVPHDPTKQITSLEVQLPAGANVGQLRQKVASHFGVATKRLIAGEVWSRRIFKWVQDYEPVIDIKSQDYIYFWELPSDYCPPKRVFKGYRYHSTLADAEEGLVIPEEEAAIVPVFTSIDSSSAGASGSSGASRAFMSRRNDHRAAGLPFFVAVPKDQVNDPDAIQRIVLEQYRRFSPHPDQIDASAAAASTSSGAAGMQDWELVDEATNAHAASDAVVDDVVESLPAPSTAGVVTEIREDGVAVEVPDVQADDAPVMVDRPSEPAVQPVHKASSRMIQSIKFTTVTEAGNPFPKGGNNDSTEHMAEDLVERLARLAQQASSAEPSKAVNADATFEDDIVTNAPEVDELASDAAMPSPPATPEPQSDHAKGKAEAVAVPAGGLPLVYTSGALICTWTAEAFERCLFTAESSHQWGQYAEAVDDEIAKERSAASSGGAANAKPKALSIEDCMDEFTREEKLGEDDPWYCPSCKDFRQATKKFDLWKAPDILVVHLKRFSAGRHSRDKLNVNVDFPLEGLDLSERVEGAKAARRVQAEAAESGEELGESMYGSGILQPEQDNDDAVAIDAPIYDLYGVDNHFGGLGGGHYTAYAKSPADGKWYEFDDSSVRPVPNPETVKSSSAYLLFYRRRTTRPIGGKSRQKFQKAVSEKEAAAAATASAPSSVMNDADDDEATAEGAPRVGSGLTLASTDADEGDSAQPAGWLPSFGRGVGSTDVDDDDFDMFKPTAPSSEEGAEPGSPRSSLSSLGSPDVD